jgi:hypothetical protein
MKKAAEKMREDARKEIEGRFVGEAIRRAGRTDGKGGTFEAGRRKRGGVEYRVLVTVVPVEEG